MQPPKLTPTSASVPWGSEAGTVKTVRPWALGCVGMHVDAALHLAHLAKSCMFLRDPGCFAGRGERVSESQSFQPATDMFLLIS